MQNIAECRQETENADPTPGLSLVSHGPDAAAKILLVSYHSYHDVVMYVATCAVECCQYDLYQARDGPVAQD